MKGIQELFSDAGYSKINSSRVRKNLLDKKQMRVPKGMKTSLEFVPAVFQELEQKYSSLWEDLDSIASESELIDENKFGGKRSFLTKLIKQINHSYASNCYDAAAVLMRRLFEVLLVIAKLFPESSGSEILSLCTPDYSEICKLNYPGY